MHKIINLAAVKGRVRLPMAGYSFEARTSFFRGAIMRLFGCRADITQCGRRDLFCFARLAFLAIFIQLPNLIF